MAAANTAHVSRPIGPASHAGGTGEPAATMRAPSPAEALKAPWPNTAGHTDPVRSRVQPSSTPKTAHATTMSSTPHTSVRP